MTTDIPSAQTRADREARQEMDDGHPDDSVRYLPTSNPSSTGWDFSTQHGFGQVYHEDPDCSYISDRVNYRTETRKQAQSKGLAPCIRCVLGVTNTGGSQAGDTVTCPFCDAEITEFPSHLPDCEEAP